jgi:hypothetical protein
MSDERPYLLDFSEEEFIALNNFMSYGATRGNHPDAPLTGDGPLTPYVNTFVNLNTRMAEAMRRGPRNVHEDIKLLDHLDSLPSGITINSDERLPSIAMTPKQPGFSHTRDLIRQDIERRK